MENAKNFILSLKLPFNLAKENRVLFDVSGEGPAESAPAGGETPAPAEGAPVAGVAPAVSAESAPRTEEKIQKDLDEVENSLAEKEGKLAELKAVPKETETDKIIAQDAAIAVLEAEIKTLKDKKEALTKEKIDFKAQRDALIIRAKADAEMEKLSKELNAGQTKFFEGLMKNLDAAKIAHRREKLKINYGKWDVTSKSGLETVKKDWGDLEIYKKGDEFFENIFKQLEKLSDPAEVAVINPGEEKGFSSVDEKKKAYLAPEANIRNIESADKALGAAVNFFIAVKRTLKTQDILQMTATTRTQEKDQDKIAATGIKFVTDNVKKFQDAIKQKDWGTALVYVAGCYIAYKGAMEIWEKVKAHENIKTGIYAAGFLYVAHMFAKNAGYDPLKYLGITASEDEVRGTSLAYFYNLPEVPEAKDIDGRILLDIGGANVADLNNLFSQTNDAGGIQFIDPNRIIPCPFPRFRGMSENNIKGEGPLDSKGAEYKRVGQELYKIMSVVRKAYDKYVKPKNGLTLEEALRKDPDLMNVSLMNFAMLFADVAGSERDRYAAGILGRTLEFDVSARRMKKRFEEVFKDKKMGLETTGKTIKEGVSGVFGAQVMDFPLAVRENGVNKTYVVFSLYDYEKSNGSPNAATDTLAEIPFEGNADGQVERLKDAIIGRFTKVVDVLKGSAKAKESLEWPLVPVEYKDGKFVSTLTVKEGSLLGKAETTPVFLKISKDGSSVEVYKKESGELILNLDSSADEAKIYGNLVMAGLGQQENMKPFFYFYKAKKLVFKGEDKENGTFTVAVGDSKTEVKFKLVKVAGNSSYVLAENEEKRIFASGNYKFLRELAENVVGENKDLKIATEEFGKVLESVPEDYLFNLAKNVPGWFKNATADKWFRGISLEHFSGAIQKNYTKAMVSAQSEFLISGIVSGLAGAGNLDAASAVINEEANSIKKSAEKLNGLRIELSNINENGERVGKQMSAEEFEKKILAGVSRLSVKSATYSLWYEKFSTSIFRKYGKLKEGDVAKAAKIVSVFAAYTHGIDDPALDGADVTVGSDIYLKHAKYANYVTEQMLAKLVDVKDDVPPLGDFWRIDSFETFEAVLAGPNEEAKKKYDSKGLVSVDEEGKSVKQEMLVELEAMKMGKDYVTFDAWLAMSAAEREANTKPLSLPRPLVSDMNSAGEKEYFINLNFVTPEEWAKFRELVNEEGLAPERLAMSDIEFQYMKSMRKKIEGLKREFPEEYVVDAFTSLEEKQYYLRLDDSVIRAVGDRNPPSGPFEFKYHPYCRVIHDVSAIEKEIMEKTGGGVATTTIQQEVINAKVNSVIESRILDDINFDTYFETKSISTKVREFWNAIKDKIS